MNTEALPQTKSLWKERLTAMRELPGVLRLVWESSPQLVVGGLIGRLIGALIPVLILWMSKQLFDILVHYRNEPKAGVAEAWPWLLGELGAAAAGLAFVRIVDYFDARLADEFTHTISLRVIDHSAKLDLSSFEDAAFYDRLERARVQATDRVAILSAFGNIVQRSISLVSLAAGVIWYSPWLFLLLFLCVLPAFAGEAHFAFVGYALANRLTPVRRELDYIRLLGSSRDTAKEVKAYALGGPLLDRYRQLSETVIRENLRLTRRRLSWGMLLVSAGTAGYYAGYFQIALDALNGRISVGTFTFLAGAIAGANREMQTLFSLFSNISEQSLFLTDLTRFLAERPRIENGFHGILPPRPMRSGLEFRNVSFSYPGSDRKVLNNLSFRLETGERMALVGENGEGKTTLVKLMARLYDPTEGEILMDGVNLKEFRIGELRKEIGILFQDFVRYDMAARHNIGFGKVEALHDDAAIWDAARRSHAEQLVTALPNGLEQMLGKRFDGGVDLSGGQWQRIALARAYLREAQIVILDEPTAALDAMAEAEVFNDFVELTRGRTAILISHRFSTVRMADRIVVLSGGRIKEEGSHEDLVATGGDYARLFETQAANYR